MRFPVDRDDPIALLQDVARDVYQRPEIANPRELTSKLHHNPPPSVLQSEGDDSWVVPFLLLDRASTVELDEVTYRPTPEAPYQKWDPYYLNREKDTIMHPVRPVPRNP